MLLLLVPLALIPASILFSACAAHAHGVMVSRSAALVMAGLALCGAFLPLGRLFTTCTAGGWRAWLASPMVWALLALAWQALTWLLLSYHLQPGLPWILDRAAALAVACMVGAACARSRTEAPRLAWALAGCGALVLILAALARFGSGAFPHAGGDSAGFPWLCYELGLDAPFGNQNFDISGALPLLGMSAWLWWRERQHPSPRWLTVLLALGWVAGLMIACGLRDDHSGRALPLPGLGGWLAVHGITRREGVAGAGLEIAAAAAVASVLWLVPRRLQLGTCLLGFAALIIGIFLFTVGALHVPQDGSPSLAQRPWMWRCAITAIGESPIAGYGVGSAVDVLNHQDAYSEVYLTVPSYPEQAHDEGLETLLDGGAVNLVLVCGLLLATVWPLWRRRDEPVPAALLIAWTMLIVHALVDVELSQAGPVLMLALLGGVSWYVAREGEPLVEARAASAASPSRADDEDGPVPTSVAWRIFPALVGCALLAFSICELSGFAGNVPELEVRHERADRVLARHHQAKERLAALKRFEAAVGNLDENAYFEARLDFEQDPPEVDHAREACLEQSRILPIQPDNLMLMVRLMRLSVSVGEGDVAARLHARIAQCMERMRLCLARVGDNGKNHELRTRMAQMVDHAQALEASAPPREDASATSAQTGAGPAP